MTAAIEEWGVDVPEMDLPAPDAERIRYPLFRWTAKPVNIVVENEDGEAAYEYFTGFICRSNDEKNPLPDEYTQAFEKVGMKKGLIEFANGRQEEHWLVTLFEVVVLTESIQTLDHVKSDNDAVAKAVAHNIAVRSGQIEEPLQYPDEVLSRSGIALGWAPERDFDTKVIKYTSDGKQMRRSFLRIPVLVRRVVPAEAGAALVELNLPIQLGFRKTLVDNAIDALARHRSEIIPALAASEKCRDILNERHKAYQVLTGVAEPKSIKYWHVSLLFGSKGKGKKKAKSGSAVADVMIPGLVLSAKAYNTDKTLNEDWLAQRIITIEERRVAAELLDEVHEWACTTSFRMIDASDRAPEE